MGPGFNSFERQGVKHMQKLTRRRALEVLGSAGAAMVAGCSSSATAPSATAVASSSTTSQGTNSTACAITPSETEGPYPDRTGMLNNPAFHRRDITEGRSGVPLELTMHVVNAKASCGPIANAVVEVWHCDVTGTYSEYGQGAGQTFLRGLQTTDASGAVTFNTIYPGWYEGRATHIHVEVYVNGASVKVTQIAFPEGVSAAVYASGVYASHGQNSISNARDNVFADGVADELATVGGSPTSGYTAALTIGVSV
jgi:protocatechuate 3,4-dioxygenase beta subunit